MNPVQQFVTWILILQLSGLAGVLPLLAQPVIIRPNDPFGNQQTIGSGVENLRLVEQNADGTEALLTMDYSYDGFSGPVALLLPIIGKKGETGVSRWFGADPVTVGRGRGTVSIKVRYFNDEPGVPPMYTTDSVQIWILNGQGTARIAAVPFLPKIRWGSPNARPVPQTKTPIITMVDRDAMRKAAEEKRDAETKARAEVVAREKARQVAEAEAKARKQAEEKARAEAQEREQARLKAEAESQRIAQEKRAAEERRLAEEKKSEEARQRAKTEALRLAQEKQKAEEKARLEASAREEARKKAEAEEMTRRQAEEKALAEARSREEARKKAAAEAKRLEEEKRLAEAKRVAEEKAREEARLKAEAEKARLDRERKLAEEKALAEAKAREQARLKADAEAKRLAEEKRIADLKAQQEAQEQERVRLAAEAKVREEARLKAEAEKARLAKERKLAEEKALAEAKAREEARLRAEAEARRIEEERRLAEQKALAEAKAREEARLKAEAEARKLEEEKALAEARALAEAKAREEARLRAEAEERTRKEAEAKALAEAKTREEQRLKAEAEARRIEEERKLAEVKRIAEEKQREEARLKAEAEAARLAQEKRAAEEKALAEAKARQEAEEKVRKEAFAQAQAEQEARKLADEKKQAEALAQAAGANPQGGGAAPVFEIAKNLRTKVTNVDVVSRSIDRSSMTFGVEFEIDSKDKIADPMLGVDIFRQADPAVSRFFQSRPSEIGKSRRNFVLFPVKFQPPAGLPDVAGYSTDQVLVYVLEKATGRRLNLFPATMLLKWWAPGAQMAVAQNNGNNVEIENFKQNDQSSGFVSLKYTLLTGDGRIRAKLFDSKAPASAAYFTSSAADVKSGRGLQLIEVRVDPDSKSPTDIIHADTLEIELLDASGKVVAKTSKQASMLWSKPK